MDPSAEIEVEADRHTSAVDLEEKESQPVPLGQLPADLEVKGAMRLVIKGAPEPEPLPALFVDPDEFTNGLIDVVRGDRTISISQRNRSLSFSFFRLR